MNIIIDINHPAHVHFFKYFYYDLIKKGHKVKVVAVEKEISILLLKKYNIPFVKLGRNPKTTIGKIFFLFISILKLLVLSFSFKPDMFYSIAGIRSSIVAFLLRKNSFVFDDTEHSTKEIALYKPFATKIFTPDCFLDDLGPKQVRYSGYHELAYLHPNRFKPNPKVLKEIGLTENDIFFVVRFVSWEATHDVGQKGLSLEDKRKLIELLKPQGKIIISSEKELPTEFEEYRMKICPTKMHDLLYYATMYVGESGTMATESSLLGVPSILINPLAKTAGNHIDLQNNNLQFYFDDLIASYTKIESIINNQESKQLNKVNLNKILISKIDVIYYIISSLKK